MADLGYQEQEAEPIERRVRACCVKRREPSLTKTPRIGDRHFTASFVGGEWAEAVGALRVPRRFRSSRRADNTYRVPPTPMDRPTSPLPRRGHQRGLSDLGAQTCRESGGPDIAATRTNAVPPTKIAPRAAKISHQVAEGTPIWVRPRVA